MLKYAIGDVHGCRRELEDLLDLIRQDANDESYQLIFLGDYIDRGPDSKGVIDLVRQQQNAITLRGNHEDMMVADNTYHWMVNGGTETVVSFYGKVPDEYFKWIHALPYYHEDEYRIYVHGGIVPYVDWERQKHGNMETLVWMREPFLFAKWPHPTKLVVHGHTPQEEINSDFREVGRLNLDTACVFGGKLSAAKFVDGEQMPVKFIQV